MSLRSWIRDRMGARPLSREGEAKESGQTEESRARVPGGVPDPTAPDTHSTTGTTQNETFVGRASGDESDVGMTGAEKRAEAEGEPPTDRPSEQRP